jgi:hypothetical protein
LLIIIPALIIGEKDIFSDVAKSPELGILSSIINLVKVTANTPSLKASTPDIPFLL